MKVLIFAYTPFQCMAALAIKEQFYNKDEVDIMISDSVYRRDIIRKNILAHNIFKNVLCGNIREFFPKSKNRIKHEWMRLWSAINPTYIADRTIDNNVIYDVFITTEINYFTESIYSFFLKRNPELKVELMDEGYSSYTHYFRENYKPTNVKNKIKRFMFRTPGNFFSRKYIADEANTIYYFAPVLLCWNNIPYKIKQIDTSVISNFTQLVNLMFGYEDLLCKGLNSEYKEKYIFFEESFFWSNKNNNDIDIINKIARMVGKENLIVKLHPRNQINRFASMGIKTNKTEGIPWELILLNMDENEEKVFITFSSGAVLNFKFLIKESKYKSILLYDCQGIQYYDVGNELKQWFNKYKDNYGQQLFVPKDEKELKALLSKI